MVESWPVWNVSGTRANTEDSSGQSTHAMRNIATDLNRFYELLSWLSVQDEPGPNSLRANFERNAIALLSNQRSPIEAANKAWLGHYSPREGIRRSGLWNLNHLDLAYEPRFLDVLETAVEQTLRQVR